jgi:chemotaxis protein histidine kinase CheA
VSDTFDDELRALQAAYGAELPGLLRELQAELDAARAHPDAMARACRKAHRIRGTASMHGFAEAAEIAGAIEDAIDDGIAVPPAILAALSAQCEEERISGSSK